MQEGLINTLDTETQLRHTKKALKELQEENNRLQGVSEKTTKAAVCPKCKKYHLICSIEKYNSSREAREDFAELLIDGFDIVNVSTEEAKANFGYC